MNDKTCLPIQEKVQSLSLKFQPIWKMTDAGPELDAYETLLRYADGDFFPFQVFNELTTNEANCDLLNKWYEDTLTAYMDAHPDYMFTLNIDLQQMQYPSTWAMLSTLSRFKDRMLLELTEFYEVSNLANKRLFFESLAYIRNLGMRIAFDDIGVGQHSLGFVTQNIHLVDSIKMSLLHMQHLDPITLGMFIDVWVRVAKINNVTFVVEGIENQATADVLIQRGIIYQQGFYYSEPIILNL